MPEEYLALGAAEGDCYGLENPSVPNVYTIKAAVTKGNCPTGFALVSQASEQDQKLLLQSLSMYQFDAQGTTTVQAGHDQFFATFGRFGAVSGVPSNYGPMLAKLLQQANGDSVSYVETMTSFQSKAVTDLANLLRQKYPDPLAFNDPKNYDTMLGFLQNAGLKDAVKAAQQDVATYVNAVNGILSCRAGNPDPACAVAYNFQAAVNRNSALPDNSPDLPKIFTQIALSTGLAAVEPRVVGVNLLSGEDSPVSMNSFKTQMLFFGYFHGHFPLVNIALHGGELTPCFVGTDRTALKDHITGSVAAGAKRVGHAVSFAFLKDDEKNAVAALLTPNNTLVEVPFASNAQILGVAGSKHPFEDYFRKYKVQVALSTDDEGVSYTDYTNAWLYALGQYHVTYAEAVKLARASLQYSFLPGQALWQSDGTQVVPSCAADPLGTPTPGETCKAFLAANAKANTQWQYESKLADFDKAYGAALQKQLDALNSATPSGTDRRAENAPAKSPRP
jgi:adenosine deaminase